MSIYSSCKALVIGVDRYADPQYDLNYARSDAEAMAELLGNEFGFNQIWTLYDSDATKQNISRFFEHDLQRTEEDDGLLIFFAGHGITVTSAIGDDRGFLVPHDGNPKQPYANLSLTTIRDDYMPMIPAKHVFLIVDACYGGLALRDVATVKRPQSIDETVLAELTRRDQKVRQVFAAGTKDQRVLDGGLFGHSVFTGRLIEALREASPYITADQVGVHVRERVSRDSLDRNHRQTPQFGYLFGGKGSFVFLRRGAIWAGKTENSQAAHAKQLRLGRAAQTAKHSVYAGDSHIFVSGQNPAVPSISSAQASISRDIIRFRKDVFKRRARRLMLLAKEAKFVLDTLSHRVDKDEANDWIERSAKSLVRSPFWFDILTFTSSERETIILCRNLVGLLPDIVKGRFSRIDGSREIQKGLIKYCSNCFEGKASFYLRAAYLYALVFGERNRTSEALERAKRCADSVGNLVRISLALNDLLNNHAGATKLWRDALAKAASTNDYVDLAYYGSAIQVDPIDCDHLLARADRLARKKSDLIECAKGYFDLVADVNSIKKATEKILSRFESDLGELITVSPLIERLSDGGISDLAVSIIEGIEEAGFPNILPGSHAEHLAFLWSNVIGRADRGVTVLREGQNFVERAGRNKKKKWANVFDLAAIGRGFVLVGHKSEGQDVFRRAALRVTCDIERNHLDKALMSCGESPDDYLSYNEKIYD